MTILCTRGYSDTRIRDALNDASALILQLREAGELPSPTPTSAGSRNRWKPIPPSAVPPPFPTDIPLSRPQRDVYRENLTILAYLVLDADPLCGGGWWTIRQVGYRRRQLGLARTRNRMKTHESGGLVQSRRDAARVAAFWHGWGHLFPYVDEDCGEEVRTLTLPSGVVAERLELSLRGVAILDALHDAGSAGLTMRQLRTSLGITSRPHSGDHDVMTRLITSHLIVTARHEASILAPVRYTLADGVSKHNRTIRPDGIEVRQNRRDEAARKLASLICGPNGVSGDGNAVEEI